MQPTDYVNNALKTESNDYEKIAERLSNPKIVRLMHAAMGLETEAGEFLDPLKKHIFYGKELNEVNMLEEIGDAMWYIAIACDALGVPLETVMERNIAKLKARFGDKFNETGALSRNLDQEDLILRGQK